MKIVQFHLGDIHPVRAACIESVKRIYSEHDYLMIDKSIFDSEVEKMLCDIGYRSEFNSLDLTTLNGRIIASEWVRFYLLGTQEDILYIDTDVMALKPFDFGSLLDNGMPYCGCQRKIVPETWMMYNKGNKGIFFEHLIHRIEKCYINQLPDVYPYFIYHEFLPKWKMKLNVIPQEYFLHYGSMDEYGKQTEKHWWHDLSCIQARTRYELEMKQLENNNLVMKGR